MLIITYIFFKTNCSHLKRKHYRRKGESREAKGKEERRNGKGNREYWAVSKCRVSWSLEGRKHVEENILVFKHAKQQLYGQIKTSKQVNITLYK